MKSKKCSHCHQSGHNRTTCQERDADPMPPNVAMRTMIDPLYAVLLVTEGSVGEALSNATRGAAQIRQLGLGTGDAMIQALAELELRARSLPPEMIALAHDLKCRLDEAQAAYSREVAEICVRLGYAPRPTECCHFLVGAHAPEVG
jgi:hypothetical protein